MRQRFDHDQANSSLRTWYFIAANFFQSKNGSPEWALSVTGGSFYDMTAGGLAGRVHPAAVRGPLRWKRPNRELLLVIDHNFVKGLAVFPGSVHREGGGLSIC